MRIQAFRLLLAVALAALWAGQAAAQNLVSGQIKAAKVENQVVRVTAAGVSAPLKDGDAVAETDTIKTGPGGSVVLVFMNGSSVHLGQDSELKIEEFKMDPLAEGAELKMAGLEQEPTLNSRTTLSLTHGELVGSVKKLHTGSAYSVKTPVGAAGIRGTIFRIVFRPTSDGKAFFQVSTAEGRVVMQGVTQNEVPIPAGKEVVVQADITPPTTPTAPTTVSNVVIVTNDVPPATTAAINTSVTTIAAAVQTTTFTPPPPPPPPTTPPPEEKPKTETTPPPTTPPPTNPVPPTTPSSTPRLTPGDGG